MRVCDLDLFCVLCLLICACVFSYNWFVFVWVERLVGLKCFVLCVWFWFSCWFWSWFLLFFVVAYFVINYFGFDYCCLWMLFLDFVVLLMSLICVIFDLDGVGWFTMLLELVMMWCLCVYSCELGGAWLMFSLLRLLLLVRVDWFVVRVFIICVFVVKCLFVGVLLFCWFSCLSVYLLDWCIWFLFGCDVGCWVIWIAARIVVCYVCFVVDCVLLFDWLSFGCYWFCWIVYIALLLVYVVCVIA